MRNRQNFPWHRRSIRTIALASLLCLSSTTFHSFTFAAETSLSAGKAKLARGKVKEALPLLKKAVGESPGKAAAHLTLGEAYARLKDYAAAREQLTVAVKLGHGSPEAKQANMLLLSLPTEAVAPRTGPDTVLITRSLGLWFSDRGFSVGKGQKPAVIEFYASWADPCRQLKPVIEKARTAYGAKVDFISVDVDNPDNAAMIDQFGVSPVPTVVFLDPTGEVVSYSVGYAGEGSLTRGLQKILTLHAG